MCRDVFQCDDVVFLTMSWRSSRVCSDDTFSDACECHVLLISPRRSVYYNINYCVCEVCHLTVSVRETLVSDHVRHKIAHIYQLDDEPACG